METEFTYTELLTRQLIRKEFLAEIRQLRRFAIFAVAAVIPFILAGALILYTGSWLGLAFILGPPAIAGLAYYLFKHTLKSVERLECFDCGVFELKEMKLIEKETQSGHGDRHDSYYFILQDKDGSYPRRMNVEAGEYRQAWEGERYYVLLIRGEAVRKYSAQSYTPDAELQAVIDGEKPSPSGKAL